MKRKTRIEETSLAEIQLLLHRIDYVSADLRSDVGRYVESIYQDLTRINEILVGAGIEHPALTRYSGNGTGTTHRERDGNAEILVESISHEACGCLLTDIGSTSQKRYAQGCTQSHKNFGIT